MRQPDPDAPERHDQRNSAASVAVIAVPILVGGWSLSTGRTVAGAVLLGFAVVAIIARLAGIRIEGYVARFAAFVGRAIAVGVSALLGVAMVVVWCGAQVLRRDLLRGGTRRHRRHGWQPVPAQPANVEIERRPFIIERPAVPTGRHPVARTLVGAIPRALGLLVIVLAVDLLVGSLWSSVSEESPASSDAGGIINITGRAVEGPNPHVGAPAMAEYPWTEAYYRELDELQYEYWPIVAFRARPLSGTYINTDGWERRSYVPPGIEGRDHPVIWVFGGSTAWGEGQRDEHTIASEIARLSEEAGVPAQVRNFGQHGWASYQEMLLYDQLLDTEPAPDLVVFYDGVNDVNASMPGMEGIPNHGFTEQFRDAFAAYGADGEAASRDAGIGADAEVTWGSVREAYSEHSAISRLVRSVRGDDDADASMGSNGADDPAGDPATDGADDGSTDDVAQAPNIPAIGEGILDVYRRATAIDTSLSADHGATPVFVWQPQQDGGPTSLWLERNLPPGTVDLTGVLDGNEDVYIDGIHTNERGARIVAEGLWEHLADTVSRWYEQGPSPADPDPTVTTSTTPADPGDDDGDGPRDPDRDAEAFMLLERYQAQLAEAQGDVCKLRAIYPALDIDPFDSPETAAAMVGFMVTYAGSVADVAPASAAGAATTLRSVASDLRAFAAATPLDSFDDYLLEGPLAQASTTEAFNEIMGSAQGCGDG